MTIFSGYHIFLGIIPYQLLQQFDNIEKNQLIIFYTGWRTWSLHHSMFFCQNHNKKDNSYAGLCNLNDILIKYIQFRLFLLMSGLEVKAGFLTPTEKIETVQYVH